MADWIKIAAPDGSGSFKAYVAKPESGKGPAIVVLQEIFGINEGMRKTCDRLAEEGYIALCPDLFWRQEPDVELTDKEEAHWQRAFELYQGFDVAKGMEDISATVAAARSLEGASGKVGAVGYCLGGFLAFMTASATDVEASVGYYGVGIQDQLEAAKTVNAPVLLHIAGKDEFVPQEAQAKLHAGLDGNVHFTLYDYPERDHAFTRFNGTHYHAEDAALANGRTSAFFKEYLS